MYVQVGNELKHSTPKLEFLTCYMWETDQTYLLNNYFSEKKIK